MQLEAYSSIGLLCWDLRSTSSEVSGTSRFSSFYYDGFLKIKQNNHKNQKNVGIFQRGGKEGFGVGVDCRGAGLDVRGGKRRDVCNFSDGF